MFGGFMELLDAVEMLVQNPLLDLSILDNATNSKQAIEFYKDSNTHDLRALIAQKSVFSDMSHVATI